MIPVAFKTTYKGFDIITHNEEQLKPYGTVLWSLPGDPGEFASDVNDAKYKIDQLCEQDEFDRFNDGNEKYRR